MGKAAVITTALGRGTSFLDVDKLVTNGLSEDDFQRTRDYLMKNVYVMTATQNQQIGYALDSKWYGIGDFATSMREKLGGSGMPSGATG